MNKLNLKPTGKAVAILFGFFAVLIAISCALESGTADAVRVVIFEWGTFPLLCAITGGVVAKQDGFLPLYGICCGAIFVPFMYAFFAEQNRYVVLMYCIFGYVGTAMGWVLYRKEVRRIEQGRPQQKRKPLLLKLFDRHHIDQYK